MSWFCGGGGQATHPPSDWGPQNQKKFYPCFVPAHNLQVSGFFFCSFHAFVPTLILDQVHFQPGIPIGRGGRAGSLFPASFFRPPSWTPPLTLTPGRWGVHTPTRFLLSKSFLLRYPHSHGFKNGRPGFWRKPGRGTSCTAGRCSWRRHSYWQSAPRSKPKRHGRGLHVLVIFFHFRDSMP